MAIILNIEGKMVKLVKAEQVICQDRDHCHRSPVINMALLEINGHEVSITQSDERFHVRIDDGFAQLYLTEYQMENYILENT